MTVYVLRQVEREREPFETDSVIRGSAVCGVYATRELACVAMRTRALEWMNRNPSYECKDETEDKVTYTAGLLWVRFTVCGYDVIGHID